MNNVDIPLYIGFTVSIIVLFTNGGTLFDMRKTEWIRHPILLVLRIVLFLVAITLLATSYVFSPYEGLMVETLMILIGVLLEFIAELGLRRQIARNVQVEPA